MINALLRLLAVSSGRLRFQLLTLFVATSVFAVAWIAAIRPVGPVSASIPISDSWEYVIPARPPNAMEIVDRLAFYAIMLVIALTGWCRLRESFVGHNLRNSRLIRPQRTSMQREWHQLPKALQADLAILLPAFSVQGYFPVASQHSPFAFGGDYYVDFAGPNNSQIRITFDRSQYTIDGDPPVFEAAEWRRAFDDKAEFEAKVLSWLNGQ